jgi:hypothetical protein
MHPQAPQHRDMAIAPELHMSVPRKRPGPKLSLKPGIVVDMMKNIASRLPKAALSWGNCVAMQEWVNARGTLAHSPQRREKLNRFADYKGIKLSKLGSGVVM